MKERDELGANSAAGSRAGAGGRPRADTIIKNATQVLTCAGDRYQAGRVDGAWIAISGETISAVGTEEALEAAVERSHAAIVDARGGVVAPGFVDCHTHLVFGGSRVDEYAARMTVDDLAKLRQMGIKTGIQATVEQTRQTSTDDLVRSAQARVARMLTAGTTTVESKSGYGLSTPSELRLLEVNRALNRMGPVDVVSTFLGAHGFPLEVRRDVYIASLLEEMIPAVAEKELAQFADVWCDDGYYTSAQSRMILESARGMGMEPKIHADAYSYIGGSELAADMRMASVDHLNYTPRAMMRRLAEANVVGVVMPALDFAVRHPRPFDARAMIDEGMALALATDLCPGCWAESQQFVMALACRLYGMSPEEALWAATMGGAMALNLQGDRGSIEVGKLADLQIWDVPSFEHVIYRLGGNIVSQVFKRGRLVVDRCKALVAGVAM
jgi:imidazolonepropionase